MLRLLSHLDNRTLPTDNGKEFAGHARVATMLGIQCFFAHPYSTWERGTSENTNGLIRQYIPKKQDFALISEEDILFVTERLNNRPRKCLAFRTPSEVYFSEAVALAT